MSLSSTWSESVAGLLGDSIAPILVVKWTVVLAMSWLAHGLLARRNPRWRVALWRGALVAVVLVPLLSSAPPIVEYPLAYRGQSGAEAVRRITRAPLEERRAAEATPVRESTAAIDLAPASAQVARRGVDTSSVATSRRPAS